MVKTEADLISSVTRLVEPLKRQVPVEKVISSLGHMPTATHVLIAILTSPLDPAIEAHPLSPKELAKAHNPLVKEILTKGTVIYEAPKDEQ